MAVPLKQSIKRFVGMQNGDHKFEEMEKNNR